MFQNNNPNAKTDNKQKVDGEQKPLVNEQKGQTGKIIETPEMKITELTQTLKRLQAEFENYQKRSARQNDEYKVFANAKLIEEILPVLDTLEAGIEHNKELVLVHDQIFTVLKKNGLQKIVAIKGRKFDHDTMECLMQERNFTLPDGSVANILLTGYMLNGKVLRATKVSVNSLEKEKPKENEKENKTENEEKRNSGESADKKIEDKKDDEKEEVTRIDRKVQIMEE